MKWLANIFGDANTRFAKKNQNTIEAIGAIEPELAKLNDAQLRDYCAKLRQRVLSSGDLESIVVEAFALTREAAKRQLKQRHFEVQLLGALALHQGKIAEMKTGEGKTLTSTPAILLNALAGKGVHVVTVNDYLARRDAVWMGQIFDMLGLSVGCITNEASYLYNGSIDISKKIASTNRDDQKKDQERDSTGGFRVEADFLNPCTRREAYAADITYGTNNEFGFDYLRDNLVFKPEERVQRDFYFAIVDEVDSILIDEARTPLIISQPDLESSKMYQEFSRVTPALKENLDFNIDAKMRVVTLTEEGIERIEKILGVGNIYTDKGINYLHHLEEALKAQFLFHKDKDYIVKDGKVVIVDEFTGRLLPGRRYSGGLHQAIEAKERVDVQAESKTLATITFQNYFRFYQKLAGMTGTAVTSAEEFDKVYGLEVIVVPTNKSCIRKDLADIVYKNESIKYRAIVKDVKKRYDTGQPVLVGTTSIEKNEYLSKLLKREGIPHEVLNAKQHEREGQIIAQAGRLHQVTVATNMAGRGVDIILGGNPPQAHEAEAVRQAGGLHVIGTERHEARRIDNQLRGRAGRQGDSGSSQFFISLEDNLIKVFGGDRIKSMMDILKMDEDQPISAGILSGAIERAQEKVEGLNFDLRKHILEYDDVIAKHRNRIYALRREVVGNNYEDLKRIFLESLHNELAKVVSCHSVDSLNYEEIAEEARSIFPPSPDFSSAISQISQGDELTDYLFDRAQEAYELKEKKETADGLWQILRFIYLKNIDYYWSEHLESLEHLRDAVRLRAYGGRDPLVEYKTESHHLFNELVATIDAQVVRTLFKLSMRS